MAAFAFRSKINKMTTQRLAAIFQPAIQSPVKAGEDFIEEASSRQLSQDALNSLSENLNSFLVGIAAPYITLLTDEREDHCRGIEIPFSQRIHFLLKDC